MKILIGTKNPGKLREMEEFFQHPSLEVVSLRDFPDAPDVEETGKTFEENSLLKAKTYFEWSGIAAVADDGGLEIDYLNGEPGVFSRRWPSIAEVLAGKPGYEASDQELIDLALKKLKGVPREKRTAQLRIVLTYFDGTHALTEEAAIRGYITEKQTVPPEKGYPFRAIFWVPELNKLYQDLTHEEHDRINHRRAACVRLRDKILELGK